MQNKGRIDIQPDHVLVSLPKELELSDTIDLMLSEDYKERFQAEYWQAKIRYEKLCDILIKHEAKTLGFELSCPVEILEDQKYNLEQYIHGMRVRAEIEKITLE